MNREELIAKVTDEVMARLGGEMPGAPVRSGDLESIIASGASRITAHCGVDDVRRELAGMIDHTMLKPDATTEQVAQLCEEAKRCQFASVCINPCHVSLCAQLLRLTNVKVCTVIGFPLGATLPEVKAFEAERAMASGAQEIDMVANIGAIKSKDFDLVERDIKGVVTACRSIAVLKVIIETALLSDEEKVRVCQIAKTAGADFVKTSTGFSTGGATTADVALMRATVGSDMGVKASGGIRDLETATEMLEAGATRIGASASVKIVGC
ncbi:deoxyribose-phosphate aldolase [bacterium]|nr:deoxyribose-phosphate aldolase [bacterium]